MSLLYRIYKSKRALCTNRNTWNLLTNVAKTSCEGLHTPPPPALCINTRSFAAPVQFQVKKKDEDVGEMRLNEKIRTPFVRLVTAEGHSVVSRDEALRRAMHLKLDLVEVDRSAKPPVCKIMDYNKEKYQKEKEQKEKERAKSKNSLKKGDSKEVRFTGKIEEKDLKIKAEGAIRLMERGYRVKCMAMGKEDEDLGALLSRFLPLVEDTAIVESGPHVGRLQAYIVIRHVKFGLGKKGAKKNKPTDSTVGAVQSAENSNSDSIQSGLHTRELSAASGDDFGESLEITNTPMDENIVAASKSSFSRIDSVASGTMHPRGDMIQPPTHAASAETINRYKKSEPGNPLPPTRPADDRNTAARDTFRVDNQFTDHKRQSMCDPKTAQNNAGYRNSRVSPFDMPRPNMNSNVPPFDTPRQDRNSGVSPVNKFRVENSTPGSSGRGFGLFTADMNQHGPRENINGDTNSRYSARDSRNGGPSAGQKLTGVNSDQNNGQATDRRGQAGFGIFSRDLKR